MNEIEAIVFDYSIIDCNDADKEFLKGKEQSIKTRTAQTVIENGRDLLEARRVLGGRFDQWFNDCFGMVIFRVKRFSSKKYHPCEIATHKDNLTLTGDIVYTLSDYRDGSTFYVGKTVNLHNRIKQHCIVWGTKGILEKRKYDICLHGLPTLCDVVFSGTSSEADRMEQKYINYFGKSLCNTQTSKWKQVPKYEI